MVAASANRQTLLILTHNLDIGGVQKNVAALANDQINYRKVIIVLLEDDKEIRYSLNPNIEVKLITLLLIDQKDYETGLKLFNYRLQQLNTVFNGISADIALSFEDYSNILLMQAKFTGKKVLSCRVSLNHYQNFPKTHLLPPEFYYDNIAHYYPSADAIICVNRLIASELRQRLDHAGIHVIYTGLDFAGIELYKQQPVEITQPFLLNCSRLHPQKGLPVLFKAFARIAGQVPHDLAIIGDGPQRQELIELANTLGISQRLHLLGKLNEPYAYLSAADLFVFPSLNEGFSNAVLEALYCGAGVIASRYTGHEEILKDYGNLVAINDVEALAAKMLHFLTDTPALARLKNQQKRDAGGFDVKNTCAQYQSLLASLYQ
ncbi:MAG: hypothetical protein CTY18_02825 [Methylomonas sp.]|nr:MAG: hypothetical protein CTY24_07265 [Methylobacter sp.]PPD36734.1 MAG: hypothetical protein CTY18_02825 [Methylomonas sp.]